MRPETSSLSNSRIYLRHSERVWKLAFISLVIDAFFLDKFGLNAHLPLLNILACICVMVALASIDRTRLLTIIQTFSKQRESFAKKFSKYSILGISLVMLISFLEASFRLYAINPIFVLLAAIVCIVAGLNWARKSKNSKKQPTPRIDLEHYNYLISLVGIGAARLVSIIGVLQGAGLGNSIILFISSGLLLSLLEPKAEDYLSQCTRCAKTISIATCSTLKNKKCTKCASSK